MTIVDIRFFIFSKTLTLTGTNDYQTTTERPKWLQFSQVPCETCTIVVAE